MGRTIAKYPQSLVGILQRVLLHKKMIMAVVLGQGFATLGLVVGTRLLTQFASTSTYGDARLVLGIIGLCSGLLIQPFSQFAMREYHDAENNERALAFEVYVRSILLKI